MLTEVGIVKHTASNTFQLISRMGLSLCLIGNPIAKSVRDELIPKHL
ncbi:hypothetical protein TacPo2_91 [Pantoea bacteriophage TacPo2]